MTHHPGRTTERPPSWLRRFLAVALAAFVLGATAGVVVAQPWRARPAYQQPTEVAPSAPVGSDVDAALARQLAAHPASRYDAHGYATSFRKRLDQAVRAARRDGVAVAVTSGYRSYERQARLYREQAEKVGSLEQARHLVLPPWESMHVRGRAVDVNKAFARWLRAHGARYGLCQRYANEWWHFEVLTSPGGRCPRLEPTAADGNPT